MNHGNSPTIQRSFALSLLLACPLMGSCGSSMAAAEPGASPSPQSSATPNATLLLADFESGSGGFSAPLAQDKSEARMGAGAGRLDADLTNVTSRAWVTTRKELAVANQIAALSFWLKSAQAREITVRLDDSSGQVFQQRPQLQPGGQWQKVTLESFTTGRGIQIYGGAGDKQFHWPAKALSFILGKNGLEGGKGSLLLDQVEVTLGAPVATAANAPAPAPAPVLKLGQAQTGNVFLTTDAIRFPLETQGESVTWTVRNFSGGLVAQGKTTLTGNIGAIGVQVPGTGYFELQARALRGGKEMATAKTTFAVTTPLDLATVKDSPFGLMTHFAQNWSPDVIPVLARGGIKNIRDEQYWSSVEAQKGVFTFTEKFQKYMDLLKSHHIDPLIVLSFGNKNYDHTPDAPGFGNAPYTDEGRAAYARYGQEVLKHYGAQIRAVEVWNEYNGTFGRGPVAQDKARYYAEMIKAAYPALKATRPDVEVVGISAVATPFPYFEDLFRRGSLAYMDAVSLHPYRTASTPEGMERSLGRLGELIKKYNNGQPKPIWLTELGWYVQGGDGRGANVVTEADQARYLVRANVLALSAGVAKFYWYHAHDDQAFPNSGILRGENDALGKYAPKPAFAAMAAMVRQLNGARFLHRQETLTPEVYVLTFEKDGQPLHVMWATRPTVLQATTATPLVVTDIMGNARAENPTAGKMALSLDGTPIYVAGAIAAFPPLDHSAGKLVADSQEEFTEKQGDGGWSYGFFLAPGTGAIYDVAAWQPMPEFRTTIWGYDWVGPRKYLTLGAAGGHPGLEDGKPAWAVRRYTANRAMKLRLRGQVSRPDKGDGITASIWQDGKTLWSQRVAGDAPNRTEFDLVTTVKPGTLLDFGIDPNAQLDYDATGFTIQLLEVP